MAECRDEGHVLYHHDQRARRGFSERQTVEHLAGTEPAICLDRALRDIGEHRISAAERYQCGYPEERALLGEHAVSAEKQHRANHWPEPQYKTDHEHDDRPTQGTCRMG